MTLVELAKIASLVLKFAFPELKSLLVFVDAGLEQEAAEQAAKIARSRNIGTRSGQAARSSSMATTTMVCTSELTEEEIVYARAAGALHVSDDGIGFVPLGWISGLRLSRSTKRQSVLG